MKESKYADLLFYRNTFNDEFTVRDMGCTPVSMTFLNGVALFSGGYVSCPKRFNGTYSVRIKLSGLQPSGVQYLMDCRTSGGTGYIRFDNATTVSASSGTIYVNGVASSTISSATKEIIVAGISLVSVVTVYGAINTLASNFLSGGIELVDVINRTLSASEALQMFSNKLKLT